MTKRDNELVSLILVYSTGIISGIAIFISGVFGIISQLTSDKINPAVLTYAIAKVVLATPAGFIIGLIVGFTFILIAPEKK